MTREEAIKIIETEYKCVNRDCDIERSCGKCDLMMPTKEPILEAYNMAIEALKQLSSYERTINKLTNAISEQEQFEKGLLIIKSVGFLTLEDLEFVRNEIIEQRKTGVVVLRHGWDAVLVPSDVEIKFE